MPSAHLTLKEEEVVKLSLEFLDNRGLHISQLSIERETGVINGVHGDDLLFLRQLILDGQWDDALEFVQPLESLETFDQRRFRYLILQHKYVELLCIKSEAGAVANMEAAVDEVVKVLNELEKYAPCKEDYSNLCLLLTLPRLSEHTLYRDWNPSSARVQCFRAILPLVEKFLPSVEKKGSAVAAAGADTGASAALQQQNVAQNDRLIQLVIKGLLYESCVDFCQRKATTGTKDDGQMRFASLLNGNGFSDSDLSLLSWLQSIPGETFSCPFEQRTLNVDVERLEKPALETSWTEHMLVTPIKPKMFPHSAMPYTRPKSADIMSRSLIPALDGLPFGLGQGRSATVTQSASDLTPAGGMSRSFAGFHLTGKRGVGMATSVDRLFDEESSLQSSSYMDLPAISENPTPPKTGEAKSNNKSDWEDDDTPKSMTPKDTPKRRTPVQAATGRDSPKPEAKAASKTELPQQQMQLESESGAGVKGQGSDLYKEYQKQKQRFQEQLLVQEKKREDLLRELGQDNKMLEEGLSPPTRVNIPDSASKAPPLAARNQGAPSLQPAGHPGGAPQTHPVGVRAPPPPPPGSLRPQVGGVVGGGPPPPPYTQGKGPPPPPPANAHAAAVNGMAAVAQGQLGQQSGAENNFGRPAVPTMTPPVPQQPPDATGYQAGHLDPTKQAQPNAVGKPRFVAVTTLEDVQAVRCAEFHPQGRHYAVGSNSKTLRICSYPKLNDLREDHVAYQPTVLFKRTKHHKGSIYCLAWSPAGDLIATGSNDKTVKLIRFNPDTSNMEGQEVELSMHDGTVRDVCFVEDMSNRSSLLISGGAGDCKIYVTDCATGTPFQALSGHSGHILSLYNWGGAMFVSGAQDKSVRFWDLRTRGCVNSVVPVTSSGARGSPVAAVCVDPSGRLLVTGHEDATCVLFDVRGCRPVQCFRPHASDVRSIRFSPSAYYLLTCGYDNKLVLTDLQGDLTTALPSVVVAQHQDKVISGRWHPTEFSFISTSADKTSTLWALPPM